MRSKKAFTIIEILVVISVIAILMGIAIPRIKGMQDAAKIVKVNKELKTLQTAMESYYINHNKTYPPDVDAFAATYLVPAFPSYFSAPPNDPFAATPAEYKYLLSPDGKYYVMWSVGASGEDQPTSISNTGVISY